ncbi:MAG: ATP-binding protein [Gemmatimonadota bacterium]
MTERRNPFRSSLIIEPRWKRFALAGIALFVYMAAFIPLYKEEGVVVSALSMFPVVVLAWIFGAWGGLLAGVLAAPLNALLLVAVGEPGWEIILRSEGGAEATALIVVVGGVIGLLRDLGVRLDRNLTEWRKAERALRETEDRYRMLFHRSRDPLYVSRPDGVIIEANDALVRLLGYDRAELMDLRTQELYEDLQDRDNFQRAIARAGHVDDFPVRLRTKSGEVRDCLISASVRYDDNHVVVEYQGSIRDVSDSHMLHRLAERRTRELQDAVQELESFTYSVSHDLRTHLVTIGGFASMLEGDYAEVLDDRGRDFLQRIVTASRRMDSFVQDLLNYSRVSRAEVRPEKLDLDKVMEDVLAGLRGIIQESGAVVEVDRDLPVVLTDLTLLERVLENLISNAIKFQPEGQTAHVHVSADLEDHRVRIKVRDNGIGIRGDAVERAFRAFERLEPGRYPGTGVGLSIVAKAVERMGGEVGVRSTPGAGSTFWVLVPAAPLSELAEE